MFRCIFGFRFSRTLYRSSKERGFESHRCHPFGLREALRSVFDGLEASRSRQGRVRGGWKGRLLADEVGGWDSRFRGSLVPNVRVIGVRFRPAGSLLSASVCFGCVVREVGELDASELWGVDESVWRIAVAVCWKWRIGDGAQCVRDQMSAGIPPVRAGSSRNPLGASEAQSWLALQAEKAL